MENKTIAAISTPAGVGGISIVRLSGNNALNIALSVFSSRFEKDANNLNKNAVKASYGEKAVYIEPRKLYLGTIKTDDFSEKSLMVFFKGPFSYTGDDIVEFQCHGGYVIAQGILAQLLKQGATLAEAGEFTKQAFVNGKLTLDEAEGVIDMINAESQSEVRAGYNLLKGSLSKEINKMQDEITLMLAKIEVTLDYPEVDYEEQTSKEVLDELKTINKRLEEISSTNKTGRLVKDGTKVLILGKPNVGKSSLLNAMLNFDRAIVTNIKGTTRDTIEETYVYKGVKFVLTDTAGVRQASDEVEKIGIEKSISAIKESDIVLLILDGSEELSGEDKEILQLSKNSKRLIVVNKTDLEQKLDLSDFNDVETLKISATNKQGITELKEKVYNIVIDEKVLNSNLMITNLRHAQVLDRAISECENAINSIVFGNSLDLVSIDIKNLWLTLGEITGESNNEEIIDRIFSSFCLGK